MLKTLSAIALVTAGCADKGSSDSGGDLATAGQTEAIQLKSPADQFGVPVGSQTLSQDDVTLEVWYPTSDAYTDAGPQRLDFESFISESFQERITGFELPDIYGLAVEDAPVRNAGERLPVLLFSHGFGGMRIQSFTLAEHLASRGYIVVAADHPGRMLTDVLPCLFLPPLEGCNLSGFTSDPGPSGLASALAWVDQAAAEGPFSNIIDPDRIATIGHSAGANSVTSFTNSESRVLATIPMAGGAVPSRDVPTLRMDGSCDGFVAAASPSTVDGQPLASFVMLEGAGHLAFSDLCSLDIDGFATRFLDGRDDLNTGLYPQLRGLGTDGCPSAEPRVEEAACTDSFMGLEQSNTILKYYSTVFLDNTLKSLENGDGRSIDGASVYSN